MEEQDREVDREGIKKAVKEIILAIGEDLTRPGLEDTPARIAEMYGELFSGLGKDPVAELSTSFEEGHREMVVLKGIPFYSLCEHHFLPFFGTADVGYIPSGSILGLSKVARALEVLARRPQVQERLTTQLADAMMRAVSPVGVAVVVEAEHLCMIMRGVKKPGSNIITSAMRGRFEEDPSVREEFFLMLKRS
ncbi:MAG: GTP cyclohydrolase I FolE [Dehalococcoidia bacterium]|nr:GTP cyclohydrolase I FolE [Dehalococcoidia bacterium]